MGGDLPGGLFRAVAAGFYAVVFVLLFVVSDPVQAGAVLFVVPVALLALSDGIRGGAVGAVIATVLVAVWVAADDVDLRLLGWSARVGAFVLIGLLVGRYEDLARSYERRRLDERYAAELHDRVVQSLVLASYRLRGEGAGDPAEAVEEALAGAKKIISERIGDVEPGDLRLTER